ncbi:tetratricopeptide repeat protein [Alphaproteobacteria bacterium]|nr:tetratricopeptide repeat protein [Alphaproteobacteria bacterium]
MALPKKNHRSSNLLVDQKVDLLFKAAIDRYQKGQLEATDLISKEILKLDPENVQALQLSGVLACQLRQYGVALDLLSKAILIKPDYGDALFNRGQVLKEVERYEEALDDYSQALCVHPKDPRILNNRANVLVHLNRHNEALNDFDKVINHKPNDPVAYYNRGLLLQNIDRFEDALNDYKEAISRNNIFVDAYINSGIILINLQRPSEALVCFKTALSIDPSSELALYNLGSMLKRLRASYYDSELMSLIVLLLEKQNFVRPNDIVAKSISLLKLDSDFARILKTYAKDKTESLSYLTIKELSRIPLLLKLMEVCPLPDLEIESLLKGVRAFILFNISNLKRTSEVLYFQKALALQCFTNEYLYEETEDELKALKKLESSIKNKVDTRKEFDPSEVACVAAYKSLLNYSWAGLFAQCPALETIYTRQFLEPMRENKLKSEMPTLCMSKDNVSIKVRMQYEENPYPRWVNASLSWEKISIKDFISINHLKVLNHTISTVKAPKILIAGCGTGQHSIETASMFKNSLVTAIDLSLSSLAYAKRKTQEFDIQNIKYIHCDILNTEALGQKFDIVESVGVLHHMGQPVAGWEALTSCLRTGGLMRIGLYSKLARHHLKKAQRANKNSQKIRQNGLISSIKSMRAKIISSEKSGGTPMLDSADFYTVSMFRDLVMHVQEHQFTIPLIKDNLAKLGLKFIGFEGEDLIQKFQLVYPKANDLYDLDKWNLFEKNNPNIFFEMYQFWCQKV